MLLNWKLSRIRQAALVAIGLMAGALGTARATNPLPGELIAPPPNINVVLFYNYFSDTNQYGDVDGTKVLDGTHLSDNIVVGRYIHTFSVDHFTVGVQGYMPYTIFAGNQTLGINNIPGPGAGFPAFGPGRASLSSNSGFSQPNFGAFVFPINDQTTGTYAVINPWISPPLSSFNKTYALNPGTKNVWTYEIEDGFRTTLFGRPTTRNLAIEVWDTLYFYGQNSNSALVSPEVTADSVPPLYQALGVTNRLRGTSVQAATYRQQPTNEVRIYLPYQFAPALRAFIAPGFYQSFGGKATYKINGGGIADSGARTNETQLRLALSTFISPTINLLIAGSFDIAAHGGPLNRTLTFRLAKFF